MYFIGNVSKADSYGNEKLKRKWPKFFFVFEIKNMVRPTLMGTTNLYENGLNPFVFFSDLTGTRMVQIRIAKSV